MPLQLPDLDTRRWADLVAEGRALLPRHAPAWTDHNVHDPGITLMELFAWLVEQDMYRVNRVSGPHRRKFLQILGFLPGPPLPARVTLSLALSPASANQALPEGTTFATGTAASPFLRFRTLAPLTVVAAGLAVVQGFDGATFSDLTRQWQQTRPISPWGPNPGATEAGEAGGDGGPALYLGWDQPLPAGVPVSLWVAVGGPQAGESERERLALEADRYRQACGARPPTPTCTPVAHSARAGDGWCVPDDPEPPPGGTEEDGGPPSVLPHHPVRVAWEYHDAAGWRVLDPDGAEVMDTTRGLTLSGPVVLQLPSATVPVPAGVVEAPFSYVRCRLLAGRPDAAPVLLDVAANAVEAEQASAARTTFPVNPGVVPPPGQEPTAGTRARLRVELDGQGAVTSLAVDAGLDVPEVTVLAYDPAGPSASGSLTVTVADLGVGTGAPWQRAPLPGGLVARGDAGVWTVDGAATQRWRPRPDLVGSRRTSADCAVDATSATVSFGDGEHARVVPAGARILAAYDQTAGAAGNVPAGSPWALAGADDEVNGAVLGQPPASVAAALAATVNRLPAAGGTDEEDLERTAGRAAERLWAHERLVESCPRGDCPTLDQLDAAAVRRLAVPDRAVTLLDYERLALDVPGTSVARARAWASLDPAYVCLDAPGTVTVVVVPELPTGRPEPTAGLLGAVRRFLDLRRVVGTRLVVVGPTYLDVAVRAAVGLAAGAYAGRVRLDVVAALDRFLDPLRGGPAGRGWPFGRDVYRSEVLEVIAGVDGVDHVVALELVGRGDEPQCGNLCVGPTWLVAPGTHVIEVRS